MYISPDQPKGLPARLRQILSDGNDWHVDQLQARLPDVPRQHIITALSRGAKGEDAVFEWVSRGAYRMKGR